MENPLREIASDMAEAYIENALAEGTAARLTDVDEWDDQDLIDALRGEGIEKIDSNVMSLFRGFLAISVRDALEDR